MSARHWHRIFSAAFGESLPALVKRVRLQRAVALLADNVPIAEVATQCGYPNVSSFTRTFRSAVGVTPGEYREHGTHVDLRIARIANDPQRYRVREVELASTRCVAFRHRGSFFTIDRAFHDLRIWLLAHDMDLDACDMYGVYLSDPGWNRTSIWLAHGRPGGCAPCRSHPQEFREDVVRVARSREDGVTLAQIAKDFGVHEMTLHKWIRQADIDDGSRPGKTREDSTELRDARKKIRLLEQENEVLRRAAATVPGEPAGKRFYPLVSELAADGIPVAVSLRVLKLSRQPYYPAAPASHQGRGGRGLPVHALLDAHLDDPTRQNTPPRTSPLHPARMKASWSRLPVLLCPNRSLLICCLFLRTRQPHCGIRCVRGPTRFSPTKGRTLTCRRATRGCSGVGFLPRGTS